MSIALLASRALSTGLLGSLVELFAGSGPGIVHFRDGAVDGRKVLRLVRLFQLVKRRFDRGLFVGGGGSVRLPRLIGASRMMEMMLTGRVYRAEEGYPFGFSHYVVPDGEGFAKAMDLARAIAGNTERTNFALIQALPRIADSDRASGYLIEALMASIAQDDAEAKSRLSAFLDKRAAKVAPKD